MNITLGLSTSGFWASEVTPPLALQRRPGGRAEKGEGGWASAPLFWVQWKPKPFPPLKMKGGGWASAFSSSSEELTFLTWWRPNHPSPLGALWALNIPQKLKGRGFGLPFAECEYSLGNTAIRDQSLRVARATATFHRGRGAEAQTPPPLGLPDGRSLYNFLLLAGCSFERLAVALARSHFGSHGQSRILSL